MKVLWLCSWYPNKLFPFNGDFIKRHAEAASLFEDITVVHLVRDESGRITKDCLVDDSSAGNLREIIVYYYSPIKFSKRYEQMISVRKYFKVYENIISDYLKTNELPSLVHVHVGMNAGLIAKQLKRKYRIPYVVSEHWTGFLSEATDNFRRLSFIQRFLWRKVLKAAAACSMVSEYLKVAMQKKFPFLEGEIIRNVVNTEIFFPETTKNKKLSFIHISTLSDFKRPEKILHAFKLVLSIFPETVLEIFGPENKKLSQIVNSLELQKNIILSAEVPQRILAERIRNSVALLLYSEYETFGCVIIEANACGIPVVVSNIPVFHEIVTDGHNGYFADRDSIESLADKMLLAINSKESIKKQEIAEATRQHYSYQVIGREMSEWYKKVLAKN